MRRYHLFTKPAKVSDVIREDYDANVSDLWQEKADQLQKRRWRRVRMGQRFFKQPKPVHGRSDTKVIWDL